MNDYVGTTSIQSHSTYMGTLVCRASPLPGWGKSLRALVDTPGPPASLEAVMWEMGALPAQVTRGELGFTPHSPPSHGSAQAGVTEVDGGRGGGWNLPVHTVDSVRLVMVPSLLVSHVNREGGVERWQEMCRHCGGERETGLQKLFPSLEKHFSKGFKAQ